MAELRIGGAALGLVRRLASTPGAGAALWAAVSGDFHIGELETLPSSSRLPLDSVPIPIPGRALHQWPDLGLLPTYHRASIHAIREAYRSKAIRPSDILESLRKRLEQSDFGASTYTPFIALNPNSRQEAIDSDQRWANNRPQGALDGVLVPVKDEVDLTGLPTRGGCTYLNEPASQDAHVIRKLQDAGAIIPGKTHATEWGLNPLGYSSHFDYPRNAWSSNYSAGGSSTGTAIAVALGLSPVGLASDGGGSIRIPASFNGLFGLKPSYSRIGKTGDRWGASTMSHLGPIGISTADLVELLLATTGVDPGDFSTAFAPDGHNTLPWKQALGRGIRGCRIGVLQSEIDDAIPAIATGCRAALAALEKEGAILVDVSIPLAKHAPAIGALIIASECAANISDDLVQFADQMGDELRTLTALMARLPARTFLMAQRTRAALRRQAAALLAEVDLLALPTTQQTAPAYPLSEGRKAILDSPHIAAATRFSFLANLTGLPAGTLPIGMHESLPFGLQLIGDAWDEASVIAAMAHAERAEIATFHPSPSYHSLLES